jgi:hypothetical protein
LVRVIGQTVSACYLWLSGQSRIECSNCGEKAAPELEERQALREAGRRLDAWMAEQKVSDDDLVADFERSRKSGRARGR